MMVCIAGWATAAVLLALFAWAYTAVCYLRGRIEWNYGISEKFGRVVDYLQGMQDSLESITRHLERLQEAASTEEAD